MNTTTKYVSLVVSAAVAGVAFFALSTTAFSAFFRSDIAIAVATAATIVGFTIRDYSRRLPSLTVKAKVLRPALPVRTDAMVKTTAYGVKSARTERLAA